MDPLSIILAALAAGATTGATNTASEAVKDTYNGLKKLIMNKFTGKPKAEAVLMDYENDPVTYELPLKKALADVNAEQESAIVEAAQKVLAQTTPQQAAMGKYNVQITGNVQGYAVGDNQQITMNFGNEREKQ